MSSRKTRVCGILSSAAAMLISVAAMADDRQARWIDAAVWNTPLNKIAQVACHNCYEKKYAPTFTSVFHGTRTVELDFWDQRDAVTGGWAKHWFVRHNPGTIFQSGNDNNCTGDGYGTNDLDACLNDIKRWSDANRPHFPITVMLDKKQGWSKESSQRTPKDLDELLDRIFGARIFTPKDLRTHIGNIDPLQTTVIGKDWPTAAQLEGKVIFVLNHAENQKLSQYAEARGLDGKIFIAPYTNGQNDITGDVSGMSRQSSNVVVMNNMGKGDKGWAQQVNASSHIGRVYGDDNVSFQQHVNERIHMSAYNDFHAAMDANGYRIRPF
ncbi:Ca2+-dependent phosphoinositide-specific phospholipase C [Burkholderia sp. S-53]|uniref:Ca2+-dependent phosphoinositide-specific phospholipase C n=1 Tax=Burkholderia sp. S-53 TaxID=2906514 RepID=UPI0021D1B15D|nr:Ca2+-dependent phosphoinositide-specific phospholipase C [Burkholderia sp. S-53]UXU85771.1 Ca2+-dependent phosphoinositide-specific phospholipase C [Burkholderia sp. S-53]